MQSKKFVHVWSHPRSASTALLRGFATRADTRVALEPFLRTKNVDGKPLLNIMDRCQEVLEVRSALLRFFIKPLGVVKEHAWVYKDIFMESQCTDPFRFLLPGARHCILIRDPLQALYSYCKITSKVGFPFREEEISYKACEIVFQRLGSSTIVIDAQDVAREPHTYLQQLCEKLEVIFLIE